jgi:FlaG/FlaF family flagellin (archaellin)
MNRLKSLITVIGAVTVLVLAGNTIALAATGHSFILGHVNYTSKQTTVARTTGGTALRVATKYRANSPFSVNGRGKVANLNSDLLDGLDSTALMGVRSRVYHYIFATGKNQHVQQLPTLSTGIYLVTYNVALFGNGGTQAAPTSSDCLLLQSGPGISETAHALTEVSNSKDDPVLATSTVLTTTDGNTVSLKCNGTQPWSSSSTFPTEVTVTKLDGATIYPATVSNG